MTTTPTIAESIATIGKLMGPRVIFTDPTPNGCPAHPNEYCASWADIESSTEEDA